MTYTATFTLTDTPTFTATPTFTMTFTPTDTPTDTPTFSDTPTRTATPTITATPMPFPYLITLGVYNEAGELVKTIASDPTSNNFTTVLFDINGVSNATIMTNNAVFDIYLANVFTPSNLNAAGTLFTWDGTTNADQKAAPGDYIIKIQQTDGYGHVATLTRDVSVVQDENYMELKVYNEAGETVFSERDDNKIGPDSLKLSVPDVVIVKNSGNDIVVGYGAASGDSMSWNGVSNAGTVVTDGVYEFKVTEVLDSGRVLEASKSVNILTQGKKYFDSLIVSPCPYDGSKTGMQFKWNLSGTTVESGTININIYDISGGLIKILAGKLEDGQLRWYGDTVGGQMASSGIYVAVLQGRDNYGYSDNKKIKIALLKK